MKDCPQIHNHGGFNVSKGNTEDDNDAKSFEHCF
jgi:hypothetical protein